MENISNVIKVLTDLGYNLIKGSNYYKCAAVYRNGDNRQALTIYPNENLVIDWVTSTKFSIKKLIALSLGLQKPEEVDTWLLENKICLKFEPPKPKIDFPKIFPPETLNELMPIHDYWLKRGISETTIKLFKGGITGDKGKMKNRYVFPIFDGQNNIVGFTGRDLTDNGKDYGRPRWKHISNNKKQWKWPLFLNHLLIKKKKEVVLVESPGCVLSLFEVGIRNVVCLFGVEIHEGVLGFLIKYDVDKIIIATNNDKINGGEAGNEAALKIKTKLQNFFDENQTIISLPQEAKDFNEILLMENGRKLIKNWYYNIGVNKE